MAVTPFPPDALVEEIARAIQNKCEDEAWDGIGAFRQAKWIRAARAVLSHPRIREGLEQHTLDGAAVAEIRRCAHEGLGFNCAFVDDDMAVLVGLAQRAVLAGLASDCKPDMQRRFSEAAEKHRAAHEKALGQAILAQPEFPAKDVSGNAGFDPARAGEAKETE